MDFRIYDHVSTSDLDGLIAQISGNSGGVGDVRAYHLPALLRVPARPPLPRELRVVSVEC